MTAQPLDQQTYLPHENDKVADVLSFIRAHESARGTAPEPGYYLVGPDQDSQIELPETVYRVLLQVLEALGAGKAVTVAPQNQLLTTQQAADLLGVSRPTVVKLIDAGDLPAVTPGTRRRMIRLDDVVACKKSRREAQLRAIFATSDDYSLDDDPAAIVEELRQIRREVAARRRGRASQLQD